MTIADKLTQIAEKVPMVYEAGQMSMVDESKIIEKTVSGSVISLDDVSEVPHEVSVQLSRHTDNLFDKNSGIVIDAYIGDTITVVAGAYKMVAIPCMPNTTYTVHKTVGERFIVGTTTVYPAQGVAVYDRISNYKAESITITTGADAKYLVAYVWNVSNDTGITADAMVNSVQIYVNNIVDFSGVAVSVFEKNIFSNVAPVSAANALTVINSTTYSIAPNMANGVMYGIYANVSELQLGIGDVLKCSVKGISKIGSSRGWRVEYQDGTYNSLSNSLNATLTVDKPFKRIMLYCDMGTAGFSYEPVVFTDVVVYKESEVKKYTANADGTVSGVKSLSPYMTIATDASGVDITATYHKSWGMQSEYDRFWDAYQQNGSLTDYSFAFGGKSVNDDWYNPKYPIIATSNTNTFRNCAITDTKVDIDVRGSNGTYVFNNAEKLVTIRKLIVDEVTVYTGWFAYCKALEEIHFEGVIGNNLDIHWSTKLSAKSIENILNTASTNANITITLPTSAPGIYEEIEPWGDFLAKYKVSHPNVTIAYLQ